MDKVAERRSDMCTSSLHLKMRVNVDVKRERASKVTSTATKRQHKLLLLQNEATEDAIVKESKNKCASSGFPLCPPNLEQSMS